MSKLSEARDVVARRKLTFGQREIVVSVERPVSDNDDFICCYVIEIEDEEKCGHAMGMDSVQAIQLAMKSIGIDLSAIARAAEQEITWLEDSPGETGFPIR